MNIVDTFATTIHPHWKISEQGNAGVIRRPSMLHLSLLPTASDETPAPQQAQLTDYDPTQNNFQCQSPIRLTVEAYSSLHPNNLQGTMGFGFWNNSLITPQVMWFFFSAPSSQVALTRKGKSNGLKAIYADSKRPLARLLSGLGLANRGFMRGFRERAFNLHEASLEAEWLNEQHTYTIELTRRACVFSVNGETVLHVPSPTRQPLGMMAWMSNDSVILSPTGDIQRTLAPISRPQALVLSRIHLESL